MPKMTHQYYEAYFVDEKIYTLKWAIIGNYRDRHKWTHDVRTIRFEINDMFIWIMDYYGAMNDDLLEKLAIHLYKKIVFDSRLDKRDNQDQRHLTSMGDELNATIHSIQRELPFGKG